MWAIAGVLVWTGHGFEETLMREHGDVDVRHAPVTRISLTKCILQRSFTGSCN
jgi:hypothetical protein